MSLPSAKGFENNESIILPSHLTLSSINFKMLYGFKLQGISELVYNAVYLFTLNSTLSWKIYETQ